MQHNPPLGVDGSICLIILVVVYIFPSIVAGKRRHRNGMAICLAVNVSEHYLALMKNSETILGSMAATKGATAALTISHNYLLEFDALKMAIAQRPEVATLDAAVREYQFALFALTSGRYRHAFVGLRLFFELMLATIQFSAHEIDYRMWAADTKDINWSALKDNQTGIFSKNFIRAFNPEFADCGKQYLAIAEVVYRECSEFVHGNASTHVSLPAEIEFHETSFLLWHEKAKTMRLAIIFIYSARYLNHISKDVMDALEPIIIDAIGTLQAVQEIFSSSQRT